MPREPTIDSISLTGKKVCTVPEISVNIMHTMVKTHPTHCELLYSHRVSFMLTLVVFLSSEVRK